jgi:hypothetical protein
VPFFLFRNKLLLTTPCHQRFYLDATVEYARQVGRPAKMPDGYRISDFFGHRVVGWN